VGRQIVPPPAEAAPLDCDAFLFPFVLWHIVDLPSAQMAQLRRLFALRPLAPQEKIVPCIRHLSQRKHARGAPVPPISTRLCPSPTFFDIFSSAQQQK